MPVERERYGRAYTRRERVVITNPMTAADTKALNLPNVSIHQSGPAYLWQIEPALEWARSVLAEKGMPLDPAAPLYADRSWRRENERTSPEWYAIKLLTMGRNLRLFVDRGEAAMAASEALDFGELVTEAKFIVHMAGKAARAAKRKAALQRPDVEQRHDALRQQAADKWSRNSTLKATEVAKLIDPSQHRNIRRVIANLKPGKTK